MIGNQLIAEENIEGSITYKLAEEDKNAKAFLNVIKKNFNRKNSEDKSSSLELIAKKNVFKIKKNELSNNDSDKNSINERSERTLLEVIKDSKSGIPMSKSKNDSDYLQNKRKSSVTENYMSRKNSVMSNERQIMTRRKSEVNPDKNYDKYFRPQLIWDPIANKMIIEKPKYSEATQKMTEEINRNMETLGNLEPHKQHLTSLSFKKIKHTDKWTEEETNFFYKALECFGTDFSFLEILLKPRTRNQIKNKYKKEDRDNKELVETALKKYDPTKLNKILAVVKHVRQIESEQKMKKLKKSKSEKTNFDFKKIFEEIETNQENVPLNEEVNRFLKDEKVLKASDEEDEDECDKTVSVNYEEEEMDEENEISIGDVKESNRDEYKEINIPDNRKQCFNMKNFYQTKVSYNTNIQVVGEVNNANNNMSQDKSIQDNKHDKISNIEEVKEEENKVGNVFLKQLQQFNN